MQLFAEGEEFAFDKIFILPRFVHDREPVRPGEHLLTYVEFHKPAPSIMATDMSLAGIKLFCF
jgi:hypothetical protein